MTPPITSNCYLLTLLLYTLLIHVQLYRAPRVTEGLANSLIVSKSCLKCTLRLVQYDFAVSALIIAYIPLSNNVETGYNTMLIKNAYPTLAKDCSLILPLFLQTRKIPWFYWWKFSYKNNIHVTVNIFEGSDQLSIRSIVESAVLHQKIIGIILEQCNNLNITRPCTVSVYTEIYARRKIHLFYHLLSLAKNH